jgi:peptide deformylase
VVFLDLDSVVLEFAGKKSNDMAILKVARLGHPVLREVAKAVPVERISSPDIQRLIQDLVETMREYGGVGLAAPQVHQSWQICAIEALVSSDKPGEKETPLMILINPGLTTVSDGIAEDWEGCLSIPDLRGLVPRHREIRVQASDPEGKTLNFNARDFFARVIQHEHDHLIGKVFLDRMRTFESLTFLREFSKYWQRNEE